jgi:O-methyltransferase
MSSHLVVINLLLAAVFLFFLGRYLWSIYTEGVFRPEEWAHRMKRNKINTDLRKQQKTYKDKVRFFNWWLQAERLKKDKVQGAFAELGVYKGESALILHLLDPSRIFHLFDTFEGFTGKDLQKESGEAATYSTKNFADTSLESVQALLGHSDSFRFHKGYFPQTTQGLENETFALVNMDVDLYIPTKAGLEFFYPRLSPGGVIIIHDYNFKWEGLVKAVDEFILTIPESLVLVPDTDGSVMIVKNKTV